MPCEQYHRVERGHGRFSRAFALPEPIDVDAVTADLKDGILTVTDPEGRRPRRPAHRRQLTVGHDPIALTPVSARSSSPASSPAWS